MDVNAESLSWSNFNKARFYLAQFLLFLYKETTAVGVLYLSKAANVFIYFFKLSFGKMYQCRLLDVN